LEVIMSDRIVSWIRTVVPSLWGSLIVWLLAQVPALVGVLETLHIDPQSPAVVGLVTTVAIGAWYALWRWVEPRIPDWLTRLVLGSAQAPTYTAQVVQTLPVHIEASTGTTTTGYTPPADPDDDGPKHAA
jgi:hypothetical protein